MTAQTSDMSAAAVEGVEADVRLVLENDVKSIASTRELFKPKSCGSQCRELMILHRTSLAPVPLAGIFAAIN